MKKSHTRGQFLATWTIFGFVLCFALQEFVAFLNELIIGGGMYIDVNPALLKYSKTFCYTLVWIVVLIFLVVVIRSKGPVFSHFNYKKSRIALIVFIIIAILSHLLAQYIVKERRAGLRPYLARHNASMVEFFSSNYIANFIPIVLIFITIAIGFYFLTEDKEEI
jgi:hypothetical protein